MADLSIVFHGATSLHVCCGNFVFSTLAVVYYPEVDETLYGLVVENGSDEKYVASIPCSPVQGWQLIKGSEELKRSRYVRAIVEAGALEKGGPADELTFVQAVSSAFRNLFVASDEYPSPADAAEMWDCLPSVSMRTALRKEYQRAMDDGRLEKSPGILARFAEFANS